MLVMLVHNHAKTGPREDSTQHPHNKKIMNRSTNQIENTLTINSR